MFRNVERKIEEVKMAYIREQYIKSLQLKNIL